MIGHTDWVLLVSVFFLGFWCHAVAVSNRPSRERP